MKYYSQYRNHDLFDLQELLSRFCKSNRWVKLGDNLPWDNIVREYNKRLQYRHAGADNKTASYSLAMGYDNMHRITSKKQHLSQTGVQFGGTLHAGYELAYTYGSAEGKKFQLDNVRDINYRTEETPTDSTNINNGHKYTYDANGNLVYINTSRVKHDGKEDEKATEQKYKWDEENRLLAADENGFVSNYWYDADGERTVKTSGENEAIYVNSEFSGGNTGTARFSLYVSPYLVAGQGGKYTKHIYVGSQRIVSKLGDLESYGADPRRIPYAGNEADGVTVNYKDKYNQQLQSIKDNYKDNYKTFDLPYNGQDNNDYVNGKGFSSNDGTPEAAQARPMNASTRAVVDNNFHDKDNYEKLQFYYHPDHLGSSSYITNLDGEVSQHIEYVPFGEVFIEERNNTWNTPYLFNAKEFDEETGMYYYGARYYEPRLSLWISVDKEGEKMPSISSFAYCKNNPTSAIDPDGNKIVFVNGKIGGGSPPAGEQYWNGRKSSFVQGAINYWSDKHIVFTEKDYSYFSTAQSRISAGYKYAEENFKTLVSDLQPGETFKFVTHSMGAAFAEGIVSYLIGHGYQVDEIVHINPFQAADITTNASPNVKTVDYQNTDDWVINDIPLVRSPGDIKNADFHLRESSNDSNFKTRHRSPIDSQGKLFWKKLQKRIKGPIIDSPIHIPKFHKVNESSTQKA